MERAKGSIGWNMNEDLFCRPSAPPPSGPIWNNSNCQFVHKLKASKWGDDSFFGSFLTKGFLRWYSKVRGFPSDAFWIGKIRVKSLKSENKNELQIWTYLKNEK